MLLLVLLTFAVFSPDASGTNTRNLPNTPAAPQPPESLFPICAVMGKWILPKRNLHSFYSWAICAQVHMTTGKDVPQSGQLYSFLEVTSLNKLIILSEFKCSELSIGKLNEEWTLRKEKNIRQVLCREWVAAAALLTVTDSCHLDVANHKRERQSRVWVTTCWNQKIQKRLELGGFPFSCRC